MHCTEYFLSSKHSTRLYHTTLHCSALHCNTVKDTEACKKPGNMRLVHLGTCSKRKEKESCSSSWSRFHLCSCTYSCCCCCCCSCFSWSCLSPFHASKTSDHSYYKGTQFFFIEDNLLDQCKTILLGSGARCKSSKLNISVFAYHCLVRPVHLNNIWYYYIYCSL